MSIVECLDVIVPLAVVSVTASALIFSLYCIIQNIECGGGSQSATVDSDGEDEWDSDEEEGDDNDEGGNDSNDEDNTRFFRPNENVCKADELLDTLNDSVNQASRSPDP